MKLDQAEIDAVHTAQRERLATLKWMDSRNGLFTAFDLMGVDPFRATRFQWVGAESIREQIVYGMEKATVLAVPDELCRVVTEFGPTYPDDRVNAADVLLTHGWAYFHTPVSDPNHREETEIRAMLWWTYRLADLPQFDPGEVDPDRHAMTMVGFVDTPRMPNMTPAHIQVRPGLMPAVSVLWELDTADGGDAWGRDVVVKQKRYSRQPYIRAMQTLWATIRQRMAEQEVTDEIVSKPLAKHARNRGRRIEQSVQVLRMRQRAPRRPVASPGSGNKLEEIQTVTGHWKNHWFPKQQMHRPKLIGEYERGPFGSPLAERREKIVLPPKSTPQEPNDA